MKLAALELNLDLTGAQFRCATLSETVDVSQRVARALRLAADQIEAEGVCPGGVYGGRLPGSIGYWVVHTEEL